MLDSDYILWLINWNNEFRCSTLPKETQEAIRSFSKKQTLVKWLKEVVNVEFVSVHEYAERLRVSLNSDRRLVVAYAHFLYHSLRKNYLWEHQVQSLCSNMPLVDQYGIVTERRSGVLVPSNGSKCVELIGLNPWWQHNYIELGEDYLRHMSYSGIVTSGKELLSFLQSHVGASDVPHLSPLNAAIPTLSSPLTKKNTLLLLNWLRHLRTKWASFPERFLSSIKNGSWLKVRLSCGSGYRPPIESFLLDSSIGHLLQNGSVLVDIPLLDEEFYGDEIKQYKEELRMIGVRFQDKDACDFIGKRLMSLADY